MSPRILVLTTVLALACCPVAAADLADETALAQRHAPIVRLVEQVEECGYGEPYRPTDVDLLFDEPTVALRGPWNPVDLVKVGPKDEDVAGLFEYHLDFPGNALNPSCGYERWDRRLREGHEPAVYSHVASDPARPGKLALQYWFFYTYNDWNNLHEGDWEMIQLLFDADDSEEALAKDPASVGYSQHEGAEAADWGDEKLELVDRRRPVVYPAAGSHANFFDSALYVGSSGEQGVGCDDTRGPHLELEPKVITIPSEPTAASAALPWISYEGRWGELQDSFFNGPTGPNMKQQWGEPVTWSEGWRPRAYAVPASGVFGTGATDFFCQAVETGSRGLVKFLRSPGLTLLVLAVAVALAWFGIARATWRPVAPLRLARRRTWGQVLSAAGRMYVKRPRLFLGIGILLIPVGAVISIVQALVLGGFGLAGVDTTGEGAGALVLLLVAIGLTLTLLGLALVQAATASALIRIDAGEEIGPRESYRLALEQLRPLLRALGIAVGVWVVLTATAFLLPVALWLAVRWSLLAPVVEIEGRSGVDTLRRSNSLVRGHWLRVATLVGVGTALALLAGPLLGALLILLTDAPVALLNVIAGIVYALAMPFVALTTAYVYFDRRTRLELEPDRESQPSELPAEIQLTS